MGAAKRGRPWLRGTDDIPWPVGWRGIALVACGIGASYVLGSAGGDAYSGSTQGPLQRHDAVPTLVITVVASTVITYFFYSRGMAANLQARMAQAQRDATEARLKLLEAQLEPHRVFNTLAKLRVLIATDPPRAQDRLPARHTRRRPRHAATAGRKRHPPWAGAPSGGRPHHRARQHLACPALALAWPRCASAWPRCMARTALLN